MKLRAIFVSALLVMMAGCLYTGHSSQTRSSSSLVSFLYPNGSLPPPRTRFRSCGCRCGWVSAFLPTQGGFGASTLDAAHREQLLERIRRKFSDRKFVSEIVIIPDTIWPRAGASKGFKASSACTTST